MDLRPLEERLVVSPGEVEYNEHSKFSGAKKTVEVFPSITQDPTNLARTIAPVEAGGATGSFTLGVKKAYRLVSDGSIRFVMSVGALAAGVTDAYLPADTPVIVKSRVFDTLSFTRTGGTFVQIVEVK